MRLGIAILVGFAIGLTAISVRGDGADGRLLVTFDNSGAGVLSGSVRAPYRARKRYEISPSTRRVASAVAKDYALEEVDHWPIQSLGIYCVVFRIPPGTSSNEIISQLRKDVRVDSAQPMQEFEASTNVPESYNDTFAHLQRALDVLQVSAAHRLSSGKGVRVAIIDSGVDAGHEDLVGRLRDIKDFTDASKPPDNRHGTAIASIIAANANNALGIVGVAPDASIDVNVACWAGSDGGSARCNSFTLAKAVDSLVPDPPDVLNLSLSGPHDPLLARLLNKLADRNVIIVAAESDDDKSPFPADLPGVVSVRPAEAMMGPAQEDHVYAPGEQIMVAAPGDRYELSSGSSLSAAHVSGSIALLLARHPNLESTEVRRLLNASQKTLASGSTTIDSCRLLELADAMPECGDAVARLGSEHDLHAQ